ncbi:DUF2244 domain-containing protein [Mesobaculum littorinae]|uniref:DUF2244 domain-containing protein n=2 Tax=Mesobaculum littorinae TaxID=2486419 RepID=A0A438AKE1_9RHOB|nr:DUF2244 domain-containing protein [Mesobaculum littorinae]
MHEGAPAQAGAPLHDGDAGGRPANDHVRFDHAAGRPAARALLWPHRSMPPEGFAWTIGIAASLIAVPLLAFVGTMAMWGLLPFVVLAIWGLWYFLRRNYRDGTLQEELVLWSDRIELRRSDPSGRLREWHANPHWVRVEIYESGGPVENYVTLRGGGREVELGAFLSSDERKGLHEELTGRLARLPR